ncbi:MAG: prolyl oligopeptidase family serine peptidase, partial [Gammaproteobacteria bacterium]|nr:prolyl oligopeptidase family serine peptidase [Gammaproteobacteria bacterium]
MSKEQIPCGCWPSPLPAELVAGKSVRLSQPTVLPDGRVLWTESRPDEQGRSVIVEWHPDHGCRDLLPAPYSAQSRANGYGGGVFAAIGDAVCFVNKEDQQIHIIDADGIRQLTRLPGTRFGDLTPDALHDRLLVVAERDRERQEPATVLASVSLADGTLSVLDDRHDFHSTPALSNDGRQLAWISWNHPDMPWDHTRLWLADVNDDGSLGRRRCLLGDKEESILQPGWCGNELLCVSDRSNWWNLYRVSDTEQVECVHAQDAEFAQPHWVFGMRNWAALDGARLACSWTADGDWHAGILELESGQLEAIDLPVTHIDQLTAVQGSIVIQGGNSTQGDGIYLWRDGELQTLKAPASLELPAGSLSRPRAVSFDSEGDTVHAFYYPPSNSHCEAPAGERPPLMIKAHGGPTGATSSKLDLKIQYWTSRGFAVLDVNYRGSTGYGRAYRQALYGGWGKVDVADIINGAAWCASEGLADPGRLLLSGSSAGGFTLLNALVTSDEFAAAASYYGVAEPVSAMRDTEKFESRYGDKLIAPMPSGEATWQARSPLANAERIDRPVIFFQGLDDRIVLPQQSRQMAAALRDQGIPHALVEFEGEG